MIILILALGIFARLHRINDLAVFLADQASDSTAVLNILHGKLTLLGPITSIGGFYNGPIVYYLMLPFYWMFRGDPIAGTVFQTTLSVATIPLVYFLGKKVMNTTAGLFAAFLFAISPLMIDYGRAAFNSYPAIFFSVLILLIFISLLERFSLRNTLILGIFIGFIIQMHYFTLSLLLLTLLYPLLFRNRLRSHQYYGILLLGVITGLTPFLMFELRHQFLNTQLFLNYMMSSQESMRSLIYSLEVWPRVAGQLLFAGNFSIGIVIMVLTACTTGYLYKHGKANKQTMSVLLTLFALVFAIGVIYGRIMQSHYIISFHIPIIILVSLTAYTVLKGKILFLILVGTILLFVNIPAWNINNRMHPLQDGLSIRDFKTAARLIQKDTKSNYNVGMHAQGDNRAMPLRYTLTLLSEKPESYEDYASSEILYFLVKKNEPITNLKMWEYTSFGPSTVVQSWDINDSYFLYKLRKRQS
ncbi:glycosyltransferase family 39 protein [Candidatus Roizmanbacteria bacterium]|nr:glycosyltransferase family 39 protein [Candidatus Roizmanbacteria bacterium]